MDLTEQLMTIATGRLKDNDSMLPSPAHGGGPNMSPAQSYSRKQLKLKHGDLQITQQSTSTDAPMVSIYAYNVYTKFVHNEYLKELNIELHKDGFVSDSILEQIISSGSNYALLRNSSFVVGSLSSLLISTSNVIAEFFNKRLINEAFGDDSKYVIAVNDNFSVEWSKVSNQKELIEKLIFNSYMKDYNKAIIESNILNSNYKLTQHVNSELVMREIYMKNFMNKNEAEK